MPNIISTQFDDLELSIIDHNNAKWLTAEQVGLALGYSPDKARQGVINLYNRHKDEFTTNDKGVIELMTPGGKQQATVFSASGCHLLSFFSNTHRAKQFRAWAKDALSTPAAQLSHSHDGLTAEQRLARLESAVGHMAMGIGQLVEVSHQQAAKLDVTARYIGLLEINQKGKVKVTRKKEAEVLALRAQGMSMRDISNMLRISTTAVSLLVNEKYPWSDSQRDMPTPSIEALLEEKLQQEAAELANRLTPPPKERIKVYSDPTQYLNARKRGEKAEFAPDLKTITSGGAY